MICRQTPAAQSHNSMAAAAAAAASIGACSTIAAALCTIKAPAERATSALASSIADKPLFLEVMLEEREEVEEEEVVVMIVMERNAMKIDIANLICTSPGMLRQHAPQAVAYRPARCRVMPRDSAIRVGCEGRFLVHLKF